MSVCSAFGCSNRSTKNDPKISFHQFPKNPDARNAWIIAVRRANWMPSRTSKLCSEHFTEDMFDRSSTMRLHLHKGAVPTVFKGFPKELQEKLNKRKPPKITVTKSKFVSKETDIVPKDINPPKYLRLALNGALTKTFDVSLEIQQQIAVKEINKEINDKMMLDRLLEREQKCIKRIKSLSDKSAEQEKQIEYMNEIISNLKKERCQRFKEKQNFVLFAKKLPS